MYKHGNSDKNTSMYCYQCNKSANYLFNDGRCKDCTRLTPEEVQGTEDKISDLMVMESAAGHYLGRSYYDAEMEMGGLPYSRDSNYISETEAKNLLASYEVSEG